MSLYVLLRNISVMLCFQVYQRSIKMKYNDSQVYSLAAKIDDFQSYAYNKIDYYIRCSLFLTSASLNEF